MKISASKTEVLHFSTNPSLMFPTFLQIGKASLMQVEKFKYLVLLVVALLCDGSQQEELNVRLDKACVMM